MPDDAAVEAVAIEVKAEPKDLTEALVQLDAEREKADKATAELEVEKEAHAAALLRGDQLAGVAADLAPKVSDLSTMLAEATSDVNDYAEEIFKLAAMLEEAAGIFDRHSMTMPPDLQHWWDQHRQEVAARIAALRASGLAKLTEDEKKALGLVGP